MATVIPSCDEELDASVRHSSPSSIVVHGSSPASSLALRVLKYMLLIYSGCGGEFVSLFLFRYILHRLNSFFSRNDILSSICILLMLLTLVLNHYGDLFCHLWYSFLNVILETLTTYRFYISGWRNDYLHTFPPIATAVHMSMRWCFTRPTFRAPRNPFQIS